MSAAKLKAFIVSSPLWPEPIRVEVPEGPLELAFATQAAIAGTVWDEREYMESIEKMAHSTFPVPPELLELWKHPVTPEVAMRNALHRRGQ